MGIFLDVTDQTHRYFPDPQEITPNGNTEQGTNNLSALAGMAMQRNSGTDEPLDSLTDRARERLDQGQEVDLRQQISNIADVNEVNRIRDTQLEFVRGNIPGATGEDLAGLLQMEAELTGKKKPSDFALEREGVSHAQELGALYPEQKSFFDDEGKYDILNAARQNAVYLSIFSDRLDKLQKEHEGMGAGGKAVDLGLTLLPLYDTLLPYVIGTPKDASWFDTPGTRTQKVSNELWNAKSPEEFATVLDGIIERFKANDAGIPNSSVVKYLSELYGPTAGSKFGINAFAAVDVMSSLPVTSLVKAARNPAQLMNIIGNRAGAVDLVADTLGKESMGAQVGKTFSPTQAVAEAMPTQVSPLKSEKLGASLSGEVNRKLAATQKVIEDVEIIRQQRLEPAQEQEAIRQAVSDAEKLFGKDKILDMNQEFDPKSGLWTNHIYLGDEYGLPFASKEAALESAQRRGLVAEAVPNDWTVKDVVKEPGWTVRDETPREYGGTILDEVTLDERTIIDETAHGVEEMTGRGYTVRDEVSQPGFTIRDEVTDFLKDDPIVRAATPDEVDVWVEQNAGTGWTLKVSRTVREDGLLPQSIPIEDWRGGKFMEKIRNPAHFLPDTIYGDRVAAELRSSKIFSDVIKPLTKKIEKVAGEGTTILSKLYKKNQVNNDWFDEATFDSQFYAEAGRSATPAEKEAYFTGIQLNDLEHTLRNEWMYEQKASRGTQTIDIDELCNL